MEIIIRNMVCDRCIQAVRGLFDKMNIPLRSVLLGIVDTSRELNAQEQVTIREALQQQGFEWVDGPKLKLVEQVKQQIVQLVHYGALEEMRTNLSTYLSTTLHKDYHHLSTQFTMVEGCTIEQYFILQKIEKVKEWLLYGEWTLSEIAFKLGYSSVAHLSAQFKKITSFTPTQFKQHTPGARKGIDQVADLKKI